MGLRAKQATVVEVNSKRKTPGRHSLGDSLILSVSQSGAASWLARVRDATGRRRDIGLGPLDDLTLAEAREKARELRKAGRDGLPILTKRERRARQNFRAPSGLRLLRPSIEVVAI